MFQKLGVEDDYLWQVRENYTFFAPSDSALDNFTALSASDYFYDRENILNLLRLVQIFSVTLLICIATSGTSSTFQLDHLK